MKLLFVLLELPENNISEVSGLYIDLVKEFKNRGNNVSIIASSLQQTRYNIECNIKVLRVKAGLVVGEKNLIKKGINMATLPWRFKKAYNQYDEIKGNYDWIVMPTPPITLIDFVQYLKKKTHAKLYLILRDIHPQSSASLGEIRYKWMINYLDKRSRKGYQESDIIGCMSQRNIDYVLEEYPYISRDKMVILYNWLKAPIFSSSNNVREKYNLGNKFLVLFGGNIALGQRIENIIDLAKHYKSNDNIIFVIIGKGVKKQELISLSEKNGLINILFIDFMQQNDYLSFVKNVDLGLISINENNAAPTCPSKVVSYMSLKIPVLALINSNNDYGQILEDAGAGYWTVGSDKRRVYELFDKIYSNPELRKQMGKKGFEFYKKELTVEKACNNMIEQIKKLSC